MVATDFNESHLYYSRHSSQNIEKNHIIHNIQEKHILYTCN